jgi:hypothetical protein
MVSTEVYDTMDEFLFATFLVLVSFVAMVFSVYVICFMAWHHARIRQYSSKLLLGHGILELFALFVSLLGFLANLRYIIPLFISFDLLLAAWILFDVLFGKFFYDGAQYKGVMSRTYIIFLSIWGACHYIVGYYDWSGGQILLFTISGLVILGMALISYIFHHDMVQFKSLRDYVAMEIDRVERGDKWKVMLVSKQYKFLYFQFPVYAVGYMAYAAGLVDVVVEGLGLVATVFFCTGILFLTIGKGCQLMGFFYPVPQWKAAIEGN